VCLPELTDKMGMSSDICGQYPILREQLTHGHNGMVRREPFPGRSQCLAELPAVFPQGLSIPAVPQRGNRRKGSQDVTDIPHDVAGGGVAAVPVSTDRIDVDDRDVLLNHSS